MTIDKIHEILNDHLIIIQEKGKEGTTKVIRQEDLVKISEEICRLS